MNTENFSGLQFNLFNHSQILQEQEPACIVKKEDLINKLNYLHFSGRSIFIHFRHFKYKEEFLLPAYPEPCRKDTFLCRLSDVNVAVLGKHAFLHLFIPSNQFMIIAPARLENIKENLLYFQLPEESYAVNARQAMRHTSSGIAADLSQNAFLAKGTLVDFNPQGFRIKLLHDSLSFFNWFNSDEPVLTYFRKDQKALFSSHCHCIRYSDELSGKEIVLTAVNGQRHQFKKSKLRNPRQQLTPSFTITFKHPFIEKKMQREVYDISTSGFSVLEESDNGTLLPGIIIPELTINYAAAFKLKCGTTQVIYRQAHVDEKGDEKGDEKVRCGFAILDMDIKTYTNFTNILANAMDPHTHISYEVDLDELWNFFFETGFIYPEKYNYIYANIETFKKTYQKLYTEHPEIARHFTYQKNGKIYAHVSLVRAYEKTWMFHHLAAKPMEKSLTGFAALKQINHFTNELCRMPSAKMDYLMCYFQPKNRFSNLFFGGFTRILKNPQASSIDLFSYLLCPINEAISNNQFPNGWELREFSSSDLWELSRFYKHHSGGLLLNVLGIGQNDKEDESIEKVYERVGFIRKYEVYSLLNHGVLNAVFLVNRTDIGFNLSNLLNCIKILICDPEGLSPEILFTAINHVASVYQTEKVPVLLYPSSYVEEKNVPYETKKYNMWVIDARFVNEFMAVTKKKFKISYWE